jgi:hypothetical protein
MLETKRIITSYNVTFIESQDATPRPLVMGLLTEENDKENGDDSMDHAEDESEAEDFTVDDQPLGDSEGTGAMQPLDQNPGIEGESPPVPTPALL